MLDTNTVSYFVNGRSQSVRLAYFKSELRSEICISAFTEAELRFGLERKPGALRLRNAFEEFFQTITILPWGSDAAVAYSKLRTRINAAGRSLATIDMLIASHAYAAGATLVSHDLASSTSPTSCPSSTGLPISNATLVLFHQPQ